MLLTSHSVNRGIVKNHNTKGRRQAAGGERRGKMNFPWQVSHVIRNAADSKRAREWEKRSETEAKRRGIWIKTEVSQGWDSSVYYTRMVFLIMRDDYFLALSLKVTASFASTHTHTYTHQPEQWGGWIQRGNSENDNLEGTKLSRLDSSTDTEWGCILR